MAAASASAVVNFPCRKAAETSGLAIRSIPAVAGIPMNRAERMPREIVADLVAAWRRAEAPVRAPDPEPSLKQAIG